MLVHWRISFIAAVVCSSLASAAKNAGPIEPDSSAIQPLAAARSVPEHSLQSHSRERVTNAIRFRSGLGPLPPRRTITSSARALLRCLDSRFNVASQFAHARRPLFAATFPGVYELLAPLSALISSGSARAKLLCTGQTTAPL